MCSVLQHGRFAPASYTNHIWWHLSTATNGQPLIIMDTTSFCSSRRGRMSTLTQVMKCWWRWLVCGVFCHLKGMDRGPLSVFPLPLHFFLSPLKKPLQREISVLQAIAYFYQCFVKSSWFLVIYLMCVNENVSLELCSNGENKTTNGTMC